MNAEAPRKSEAIGSKEFLNLLENFNKKCQTGEKLPEKDVNEFYEIISSTQKKTDKKISAETTTVGDPSITEKTISAIKQLQATLGQNKEILESAVASIPYVQIQSALNNLDHYLNEHKKESQKDWISMGSFCWYCIQYQQFTGTLPKEKCAHYFVGDLFEFLYRLYSR